MSHKGSGHSIEAATKSRASFSSHGTSGTKSLGAAGFISPYDDSQSADFLSRPGETAIVNPPKDGMGTFEIGAAWDNVEPKAQKKGLLAGLLGGKKQSKPKGVDLDIGCLYELNSGERGAIQAFGERYGAFNEPPYLHLSGDERTGDAEGYDETIKVNGEKWNEIKRVVVYLYIYGGAKSWECVRPQIQLRVPSEKPMVVTLQAKRQELALCAVAGLENVRGGIRMTNYLEYFPGHAELDRAFGFGLNWADGQKN